jgi:hypothetical protein
MAIPGGQGVGVGLGAIGGALIMFGFIEEMANPDKGTGDEFGANDSSDNDTDGNNDDDMVDNDGDGVTTSQSDTNNGGDSDDNDPCNPNKDHFSCSCPT